MELSSGKTASNEFAAGIKGSMVDVLRVLPFVIKGDSSPELILQFVDIYYYLNQLHYIITSSKLDA